MLRARLPDESRDTVDREAESFIEHLRQTSTMAVERYENGTMEDDELQSRLDVFVADDRADKAQDAPPPSAAPAPPVVDTAASDQVQLQEVSKVLQGRLPKDKERAIDLAARDFLAHLRHTSPLAAERFGEGHMDDDDLAARIEVYLGDHPELSGKAVKPQVAVDPAAAAVSAFVDAFEKANFGLLTERAQAICFRGSLEEGGVKRDLVIFKKRPNKLRIHVVEGGLVIGVIAFDGRDVWRQAMGRPATHVSGITAEEFAKSARFDDPIVGCLERGASARLEVGPGASPERLHIVEKDGTHWVETIDPATEDELSLVQSRPEGSSVETRFRDYRRVGNLNVAHVVEQWVDGKLRSTTRIADVSVDPGLVDRLFTYPEDPNLGYMDYMGGLAVLQSRGKPGSAGAVQPSEARP